jgi:hypothetical protein
VSRAFQHLPISLWHRLIIDDMPWLYEAWSLDPEPYVWATQVAAELVSDQANRRAAARNHD